jgi:hypothetical protein
MVDFKNTVLIMTSNLGTRDISKGPGIGFATGSGAIDYERMKAKVGDELKQHFRPEFLNRIDDVIVFHQLSQEEIIQIVDLMLARVDGQLKNKDMALEPTPCGEGAAGEEGLRPGAGRPAAAPDHPAGDRGHPVREDPLRDAEARRDRGRRHRRARATTRSSSSAASRSRTWCPTPRRSTWPSPASEPPRGSPLVGTSDWLDVLVGPMSAIRGDPCCRDQNISGDSTGLVDRRNAAA